MNNEDVPQWQGYFLSILLFLTSACQPLLDAQFTHIGNIIGLRLRTMLTAAIYRKVD